MEFERFKSIIKRNNKIEKDINSVLDEFKNKVKIDGDKVKLIKEVGESLGVMVFCIPMKERDFGAVSYKTKYNKYILINTNQPMCKMNFSYYHDIYHIIKGASNMINESREVHFNDDYLEDENECKANLFSASILMEKEKFKYMYKVYYESSEKDFECTIYKLMNYFSSPYMAVLLRICELKLNEDMKMIEKYINYNEKILFEKFKEFGISDEILKSTLTDDSVFLYSKIEKEAKKLIENGLLDKNEYKKLEKSIVELVEGIKIDEQDIYRNTK